MEGKVPAIKMPPVTPAPVPKKNHIILIIVLVILVIGLVVGGWIIYRQQRQSATSSSTKTATTASTNSTTTNSQTSTIESDSQLQSELDAVNNNLTSLDSNTTQASNGINDQEPNL